MIVYVGNREDGYYAEAVASKYGWEIGYVKRNEDIRNQVSEILKYTNVKVIIYDISKYAIPAKEVAETITRIRQANNAKVVIHGEGFNAKSNIVMELRFAGFEDFIFGWSLAQKKEELVQCIEGTRDHLPEITEEYGNAEEEKKENSKAKTIGIAGSIPRMGTTTQAIQLIKYLNLKGYKACYVQLNNHSWVENLIADYAEVEQVEEIGKAVYKNVDMFYRIDKLPEILKLDYDYFVYDYGVYWDVDFNKTSFLEKDLMLFCLGAKPGEFDKSYKVIENNFYQAATYIFNFVPDDEEEKKDIYELMAEKKKSTFFAPDCRDPFVYTGSEIYEQILPVESIVEEDVSKKKRRFFGRR